METVLEACKNQLQLPSPGDANGADPSKVSNEDCTDGRCTDPKLYAILAPRIVPEMAGGFASVPGRFVQLSQPTNPSYFSES